MGMTEGEYQASQVDPPPPSGPYWVTKDKRRILIVDMTDAHLVNTLRMLRRKFLTWDEFAALGHYAYTTGGEMAQYYAQQELDSAKIMPAAFDDLLDEAQRRDLAWELPK